MARGGQRSATHRAPEREPLRVLFLGHYFPKPDNRLMGPWALDQVQALRRAGCMVEVVSFTSWIPRWAGRLGVKPAWALCPSRHEWDGLVVHYPRWALYPVGPLARFIYRRPSLQERLCWLTGGGFLRRAVRRFRPDVIFAHHSVFNGCMAARLRRRFGVPFVVTEHDFGEVSDCERFPDRRRTVARSLLSASSCAAISDRMRIEIERLFPGATTRLVSNGSDPIPRSMFDEARPAEIEGKRVVFSAGIYYERKGFPLLIRAFAKIADRHPDAVLRIAGGGGVDGPAIEAAAAEVGLAPGRVQLLGLLQPSRIKQEMAWCDAFALAAWDEPFGIVFLEAASAGKAILWSRDAGINDLLVDGEHGVSMEPRSLESCAEGLDRLLCDASRRARWGRNAKHLFDTRFTWDANASSMISLFDAALGRETKPASSRAAPSSSPASPAEPSGDRAVEIRVRSVEPARPRASSPGSPSAD